MICHLYNNETYLLQIDSHHRFVKNWDVLLIDMYLELKKDGVEKPLISTYLPSYNPQKDPMERVMVPWKMNYHKLIENKIMIFIPSTIDDFNNLNKPLKGNFYSGHFAFTDGNFCKEVPYDDHLYFIGEEINMTLRSYTHGYDIYCPHILIAWHEYTRLNRTKQWDDDKEWWKKDKISKDYYKLFLEENEKIETKYQFGKVRSVSEFPYFYLFQLNNKKRIDEEWKKWIKENKKLNIDKETLKDTLLKAEFVLEDIEMELSSDY
jgi:hypothetical protein